jgi:hypothetical protein
MEGKTFSIITVPVSPSESIKSKSSAKGALVNSQSQKKLPQLTPRLSGVCGTTEVVLDPVHGFAPAIKRAWSKRARILRSSVITQSATPMANSRR